MTLEELTDKYRLHKKDTGSTAIQIILLSVQVQKLVGHGDRNRKVNFNEKRKKERWKDVSAKRALLKKIAYRKKLYQYLAKNNPEIFQKLQSERREFLSFLGIKE
jgi:ribosomal protein S15